MALTDQPPKRQPSDEERERGARYRAAWAYRSDLGQGDIADLLRTSKRTVSRIFAGETDPGEEGRRITMRETGVPSWFFQHGWDPPSTSPDPELAERVDALEGKVETMLRILTGRVAGAASETSEGQADSEDREDTK